MKIAILQLSDIHIDSDTNFIFQHKEDFFRSCKHVINECSKLIVVITGDIAYHGSQHEYNLAYKWLKECEKNWKSEADYLNSIEYVCVPGNHDCDFSQSDPVRELIIQSILKNDSLDEDKIGEVCLNVQKNFWTFYQRLRSDIESPQISWSHRIPIKLGELTFKFCCYNTAFLSKLEEKPGMLLIPENKFINNEAAERNVFIISLFHHNTGWLNPNTTHNNKKTFEQHLYSKSNIVMCGHEHSDKHQIISNIGEYDEIIYLENEAFQNGNNSGYGLLLFNTDDNSITSFTYKYKNGMYVMESQNDFLIHKKQTGILLNKNWLESLDKHNIPLTHPRKENLLLSDIFVFPDLEPLSDLNSKFVQYTDSERILGDTISERIVIIEGENQSGKSSLLQMLYSSWYKKGVYPLLLHGNNIKHYNISQLLRNSYKNQYQSKDYSYDSYLQLDRNKRVLIIDDIDKSIINSDYKSKLLSEALCNFEKIVITTGQQIDLGNILLQVNNDNNIKYYRILSLGYLKRNTLIEKWIKLGQDVITLDDELLLDQIKTTYEKISVLLGQQLIPSYPVFILSLLQGLNQSIVHFDVSKTSYAYCYNSLIIASLLKAGTDKDKINGVLKFLSEFAYNHYINKRNYKYFNTKDFSKFYNNYKQDYNVQYTEDKLLSILTDASLVRCVDGNSYSFAYKYSFYFLVAKKISDLINENKANGIVQDLCNNLHKEQEANILIFLVYHNGTEKQMEDLLFASMLPFENYKPITLDLNDPLFQGINDIVENIKLNVMLKHVDPKQTRDIALRESDKASRQLDKGHQPTEQDFEENTALRELNNTIKIIKILGQIIKNQIDSIKKEQIFKLLEESYNVCFRSIAFFSKMIESSKDSIVDFLLEKNKDKSSIKEEEIRRSIQKLLHILLYQFCLQSFANLSRSVGTPDSPLVYDTIAERIGTPAAKIISFTIKTYYNKMQICDLENIVNEFKNNPVVMEIVKARVLNYVYNNYVSPANRQVIGQICNLKLVDNGFILKKKK